MCHPNEYTDIHEFCCVLVYVRKQHDKICIRIPEIWQNILSLQTFPKVQPQVPVFVSY